MNLHAVAIAVGDIGLLIQGRSGAGKSALAARMIASWPFGRVRLVADDRVLVRCSGGRIVARAHRALAGRLEVRGLGLLRAEALDAVVLRAALTLSDDAPARLPEPEALEQDLLGLRLPCAWLPRGEAAFHRLEAIWPYFRAMVAAHRSNLLATP